MPSRPAGVVFLVLGTFALAVLGYTAALLVLSLWSGDAALQGKALENFKDFGIYAAGVLSGCLIRTSNDSAKPISAQITNSPDQPIPTTETKL